MAALFSLKPSKRARIGIYTSGLKILGLDVPFFLHQFLLGRFLIPDAAFCFLWLGNTYMKEC